MRDVGCGARNLGAGGGVRIGAIYEENGMRQRSKGGMRGKVGGAKSSKIRFVHLKYAFSLKTAGARILTSQN